MRSPDPCHPKDEVERASSARWVRSAALPPNISASATRIVIALGTRRSTLVVTGLNSAIRRSSTFGVLKTIRDIRVIRGSLFSELLFIRVYSWWHVSAHERVLTRAQPMCVAN